ncbi:hypothetical protein [Bacteroides oleiciplenus]|uniref:hypothetical protein n=1 Tax=Bacteroides oleiciplenus TaxID=626931 RepID=UPI0026DB0056|nr:hypothetical protein [Bacteroides oleiciplenus]
MNIRKTHLLILLCTFCILTPVYTQQPLFEEFKKKAGDYAALYTNKVEVGYSPYFYINHPYWDTDEFQKGAVCYNGLLYTDIKLRYDTYKKQLIVITPEKRILLQVDMRKVDYFIIGEKKFMPHKDTYSALLYNSPQMRLTQYVLCRLGASVEKNRISYRKFEKNARFVLSKDDTEYIVTSRSSFLKLFPVYKKQLKRYAREQDLNFSISHRAEALTALTKYADSLINKK